MKPVFDPVPNKTYGLMALVRGKRATVNRGPENTVMSWPHLFWAELAVFMVTVAVTLILSFYIDAPLKPARRSKGGWTGIRPASMRASWRSERRTGTASSTS